MNTKVSAFSLVYVTIIYMLILDNNRKANVKNFLVRMSLCIASYIIIILLFILITLKNFEDINMSSDYTIIYSDQQISLKVIDQQNIFSGADKMSK